MEFVTNTGGPALYTALNSSTWCFNVILINYRCTCDAEYQGADCSERICPFGHAWSDVATATDVAHAEAECSNRGICNRKNGNCSLPVFLLLSYL